MTTYEKGRNLPWNNGKLLFLDNFTAYIRHFLE